MDPYLRELCLEVLNQDINSEKFNSLIIETGIKLESTEWDGTNKVLKKGDEINAHLKNTQHAVN